jgi:hypothetical protein
MREPALVPRGTVTAFRRPRMPGKFAALIDAAKNGDCPHRQSVPIGSPIGSLSRALSLPPPRRGGDCSMQPGGRPGNDYESTHSKGYGRGQRCSLVGLNVPEPDGRGGAGGCPQGAAAQVEFFSRPEAFRTLCDQPPPRGSSTAAVEKPQVCSSPVLRGPTPATTPSHRRVAQLEAGIADVPLAAAVRALLTRGRQLRHLDAGPPLIQ